MKPGDLIRSKVSHVFYLYGPDMEWSEDQPHTTSIQFGPGDTAIYLDAWRTRFGFTFLKILTSRGVIGWARYDLLEVIT